MDLFICKSVIDKILHQKTILAWLLLISSNNMNESPDKIIIYSAEVFRDLSKYLSSVGSLHLNESKKIINN